MWRMFSNVEGYLSVMWRVRSNVEGYLSVMWRDIISNVAVAE